MGFFDAPKREPIPPHTNRVGTRAQTFSAAPIGRPTAGLGKLGYLEAQSVPSDQITCNQQVANASRIWPAQIV